MPRTEPPPRREAPTPPPPPRREAPTPPPPYRPPHSRSARVWQILVAALVGLVILAACGFLSYRLIQEERNGRNAQANTPAPSVAPEPRDISSREADSEPLTADEVFPNEEIVINADEPPYVVLDTEVSEDCATAAADELAALLEDLGCSQVARAAIRSPDEEYVVTGGIFNLATEEDAEEAYDGILPLIESGAGRFLGLLAGDGTESFVLAETRVGVDYRGHYLLYAVIARADSADFSASDDRHADVIFWDMIEIYLRTSVLDQRTAPLPPGEAEAGADAETADTGSS